MKEESMEEVRGDEQRAAPVGTPEQTPHCHCLTCSRAIWAVEDPQKTKAVEIVVVLATGQPVKLMAPVCDACAETLGLVEVEPKIHRV